MSFKLPGQQGWKQLNRGRNVGTIVESFNIDLNEEIGSIIPTRTKLMQSGDDTGTNFGNLSGTLFLDTKLQVYTSGDNWQGGNSPFDSISREGGDGPHPNRGDAVSWNERIYISTDTGVQKSNVDGTTYSNVDTGSELTSSKIHLLSSFQDRLYVTDDDDKVFSYDTGDTFSGTSGSFTLDLDMGQRYPITVLMAGNQKIWVGVSSASDQVNSHTWVYTWDGQTENTPTRRYKIDAAGLLAGVMKDDVPYLLDTRGRLLGFSGGAFKEITRFPDVLNFHGYNNGGSINFKAVHPRGMAVDGEEILINVSSLQDGSSGATSFFNDFNAGVWAYNERNGLYHKYSPSYQAVADTGTSNMTDYGQRRFYEAGPIDVITPFNWDTSDGGRVVFGARYFTDADDSDVNNFGIWTNDTADDTQKAGYFVTRLIKASEFDEAWQEIAATFDKLQNSTDYVALKYKLDAGTPVYGDGTWSTSTILRSVDDLSSVENGDEVQILHGDGGGACYHISSITDSYRMQLDKELISGVDGTCRFKIEKWRKIVSTSETDKRFVRSNLRDAQSPYIQFKVFMVGTGGPTFHELFVRNANRR